MAFLRIKPNVSLDFRSYYKLRLVLDLKDITLDRVFVELYFLNYVYPESIIYNFL